MLHRNTVATQVTFSLERGHVQSSQMYLEHISIKTRNSIFLRLPVIFNSAAKSHFPTLVTFSWSASHMDKFYEYSDVSAERIQTTAELLGKNIYTYISQQCTFYIL